MLTTIECAGHPRDMGLAQGSAAREAIRSEVSRLGMPLSRSRIPSLRGLAVGDVRGAGAGREMFRHFAHQAERLEGVARSAGVPIDSILDLHLRIREGGEAAGLLARRSTVLARAAASSPRDKRLILERTLPRVASGEAGWILRESRPEVGFRSLEVGLPWLVSSVAGVNEGGLAVVAGPVLWGREGRQGQPTSLLLVQECLQRFEDLDGAIGWCRKRPVEGEQSIVLADASGALVTVIVSGCDVRVQEGDGELHLEGGELAEETDGGEVPASPGTLGDDRVWIDARGCRLRIRMQGVDLDTEIRRPPSESGS